MAQLLISRAAEFNLMKNLEQTLEKVNTCLVGIACESQRQWHSAAQYGAPEQTLSTCH